MTRAATLNRSPGTGALPGFASGSEGHPGVVRARKRPLRGQKAPSSLRGQATSADARFSPTLSGCGWEIGAAP